MRGFARVLLLSLGLVLGGMGCLAGPQPDPPNMRGDIDPALRPDSGGAAAADAAGPPARDAGVYPPPDPGRADGQFQAGAQDDADGEQVARTQRRDDLWRPEDRIPHTVPSLDAGAEPDAGTDEADTGM